MTDEKRGSPRMLGIVAALTALVGVGAAYVSSYEGQAWAIALYAIFAALLAYGIFSVRDDWMAYLGMMFLIGFVGYLALGLTGSFVALVGALLVMAFVIAKRKSL